MLFRGKDIPIKDSIYECVAMPPILKPYQEMTKKEAQTTFAWFMEYLDVRIHNMCVYLQFEGDYTPESLIELWKLIMQGYGVIPAKDFPMILTCAGLYWAETFRHQYPQLKWECLFDAPKRGYRNHPVLTGFVVDSIDPPYHPFFESERMIQEQIYRLRRKEADEEQLIRLFEIWSQYIPGHAAKAPRKDPLQLRQGNVSGQDTNHLPNSGSETRKMDEAALYELIGRMNFPEKMKSSKDSVRWHAHREAERISDPEVFPLLIKIIEDNQQKKSKNIRDAAYFIIGRLLKKSFDRKACCFMIQRIALEDDKEIISNILNRITYLNFPQDIDITPIVECAKSEKWLIRHSALRALGASATEQSRDALKFYLEQDDEKQYRYELVYANVSLGRIGTVSDIPLLEQHLHSRSPDIRNSAEHAIIQILSTDNRSL
jgi:HEAT repeat protein